jgi:hypothetical protein
MPKRFRLTPPAISENDVEFGVKQVLLYRGYGFERLHTGVAKTLDGKRYIKLCPPGTPDYMAIHETFPGLYIEVKRPGGALRPEQEQRIWELRQGLRLTVAVIDSPAELSEFLNEHERKAGRAYGKNSIHQAGDHDE